MKLSYLRTLIINLFQKPFKFCMILHVEAI